MASDDAFMAIDLNGDTGQGKLESSDDMLPSRVSDQVESERADVKTKEEQEIETFWQGEINRAERLRRTYEPRWRKARKEWACRWFPRVADGRDNLKNPVFYSDVEVEVSNLAANAPVPFVSSQKREYDIEASMVRNALKFEADRIDIKSLAASLVRDCKIYNQMIVKIGYTGSKTLEFDADSVFVKRISPFDYLIDPECTSPANARWEGNRWYMDLEDFIEARNEFINVDEALQYAQEYVTNSEMATGGDKSVQTGRTDRNEPGNVGDMENLSPSPIKRLQIYEIYDKERGEMLLLVNGQVIVQKKSFGNMDSDLPYIHKSPFVLRRFNEMPDSFFSPTDYDIHESKLSLIDEITNRINEYTKRMIPKGVVRKGALNPNEIQKIMNGKTLSITEVDLAPNQSAENVISWLQGAPLTQDNMFMLQYARETHSQDSGIADYMKGGQMKARTATEAQMVGQGAQGRAVTRQGIVDAFWEEVFQKMFYVIKHTYKAPRWIGVAGKYPMQKIAPDGTVLFARDNATGEYVMNKQHGFWITPDVLQADLQIKIEAGSSGLNNSIQKQQVLMNMVQMFSGVPMFAQAINWNSMLRELFNRFNMDADELMIDIPNGMMAPLMGTPGQPQMPNPQQAPQLPATEGNAAGDFNEAIQGQLAGGSNVNPI